MYLLRVEKKKKQEETLPYDSPQNIDLILKMYIHVIYLSFGMKGAGGLSECTCFPLIQILLNEKLHFQHLLCPGAHPGLTHRCF